MMAKFIYLYSGGTYPETPEEAEKIMADWGAWMGGLGDALVDGGNPLGDKVNLGEGGATPVNGYSFVEAADLDAAKTLADNHPHLAAGGSIEIAAFAEM